MYGKNKIWIRSGRGWWKWNILRDAYWEFLVLNNLFQRLEGWKVEGMARKKERKRKRWEENNSSLYCENVMTIYYVP